MAKDLVSNAADGLLAETLKILKSKGSDADKVAEALDHLELGMKARKLAAKRQKRSQEPKAEKPAIAKTSTPTVSATPKVDTVVAAQANGKTDQKGGWLGK